MMSQVAFEIFGLTIHWYGVFFASSFLAGMGLMHWRAKQTGFPVKEISDIVFSAMVGTVIGARVWFLFNYPDPNRGLMDYINITDGGLVFYGGMIGCTLAILIHCKRKKFKILEVADLACLALPLGQLIGRWGCYMSGCCHGLTRDSAISVSYSLPEYNVVRDLQMRQIDKGLITAEHFEQSRLNEYMTAEPGQLLESLPVIPAPIIQSATNLVILIVILLIMNKLKKRGQLFSLCFGLYAGGRFLTEFIRGDYIDYYMGSLTISQVFCLILMPVCAALFYYFSKNAETIVLADPKTAAPPGDQSDNTGKD